MEQEWKNGLDVGILFPENSIVLLKVNWHFPYFKGQNNEFFIT